METVLLAGLQDHNFYDCDIIEVLQDFEEDIQVK